MSKYIVTHKAEQDLAEILYYIAQDSPKRAHEWLDKIFEAIEKLAEYPDIARARLDLTDQEVKFWPIGNYFIVYRKKKVVEILHVVSSFRDVPNFLQD